MLLGHKTFFLTDLTDKAKSQLEGASLKISLYVEGVVPFNVY